MEAEDVKLREREVEYHEYLTPYTTLFCIVPLPPVLLEHGQRTQASTDTVLLAIVSLLSQGVHQVLG